MQAIAYEGYFDNGLFYVSGKTVQIPDKRRVFVAILDDVPDIDSYMPEANNTNLKRNLGFMDVPPLPESFFDPLPEEELQAWGL